MAFSGALGLCTEQGAIALRFLCCRDGRREPSGHDCRPRTLHPHPESAPRRRHTFSAWTPLE